MATDPLFEALVGHINGSKPRNDNDLQQLLQNSFPEAPQPVFSESQASSETAPEPTFAASERIMRPQDRWDADLRSILIVNFTQTQDKMNDEQRDQRGTAMSNVHLSNQHLVQSALRSLEAQIEAKKLSPDQDLISEIRRSTYRAKVLSSLIPRTPW